MAVIFWIYFGNAMTPATVSEMETDLSKSEVARERPNMEIKEHANMVKWSPVVKEESFVHKATMCFDSFLLEMVWIKSRV